MSGTLAALEGVAVAVRSVGGIVTELVEGVAKAARHGTAGYDAVQARRLKARLLDLRAALTRFSTGMNAPIRGDLLHYLREWAETAPLHTASDMLDPAARQAALHKAFAGNRRLGMPVPDAATHDARLAAAWATLGQSMRRAAESAAEILESLEAERSEAILDDAWVTLVRGFRARLAIYAELAGLPPPVSRAEVARLVELAEAYAGLIAELEAANSRLAALIKEGGG